MPAPPTRLRALAAALTCLLALVALAACGGASGARLSVTGSTSMTPFVELLAEHYQKANPGAAVDVQGLGSSAGIRAATEGVSELGMSSRDLTEEERAQLDQMVMARDALAVIVHPQNPVHELSAEQIRGIFTGAVTSWAQVGGPDRPIVVVSREAGSGTFSAFEELVMKGQPISQRSLRQGSNGAVRQIIGDTPDSIGYISLGIVDESVRAVTIDGVSPTVAEVEAGHYTLVRPFLLVWRRGAQLSPLATSFLAYVSSPAGQDELARGGLVPGGEDLP